MDRLQNAWRELNERYFHGRLRPISIVWSRRLTASVGMFVSHVGPRASWISPRVQGGERRLIRLSIPLLQDQPHQEIVGTLAHEMIHQWQYDILKRHPNHGPEFHRMMAIMNRDGLGITIRHSLDKAVHALTKYTWRCTECGRDYHRQRNTIRPGRHRCGECLGKLRELPRASVDTDTTGLTGLVPTTMSQTLVSRVVSRRPSCR
ncbi:MAG: SprT-like domain-containing protein [Nitrospirales bacterium]